MTPAPRETAVCLDDEAVSFPCTVPVPEVRWNGWSCPTFDLETALRVIEWVAKPDDAPASDYCAFIWTTDREGLKCLLMGECLDGDESQWYWEPMGDERTGFPIGAWAWVWSEVQDA